MRSAWNILAKPCGSHVHDSIRCDRCIDIEFASILYSIKFSALNLGSSYNFGAGATSVFALAARGSFFDITDGAGGSPVTFRISC